ncbi:hypothetical protein ACA910_003361 [Epithemia clementina (nom. ined.)]
MSREIADDGHNYVDNIQGTAPTAEDAWQVGSCIAKIVLYHGVQDAARKRHEQTQRPGAWAGVVCGTLLHRSFVSITQTKWDKAKSEIAQLREQMDAAQSLKSDGKLDRKTLEQVAGYLNHVARAYPTIKIYLNGVYASLNVLKPDQDENGWKTGQVKVKYNSTKKTKQR